MVKSIRVKLDERNISKTVSKLLFVRRSWDLPPWRFMGISAVGITPQFVSQLLLLAVTLVLTVASR